MVLRGPRPPSVKWRMRGRGLVHHQGGGKSSLPQSIPPPLREASRRGFRGIEIGECDPGAGGDEPT